MYIIIYTVYIYINIVRYLKSWICKAKCVVTKAQQPPFPSDPKVLVHFENQINAQKCVGTPQFSDLLRFLLGLPWGVVQEW